MHCSATLQAETGPQNKRFQALIAPDPDRPKEHLCIALNGADELPSCCPQLDSVNGQVAGQPVLACFDVVCTVQACLVFSKLSFVVSSKTSDAVNAHNVCQLFVHMRMSGHQCASRSLKTRTRGPMGNV